MTLDEKLRSYKGLGPGFDFLRIGLATLIVVTHSFFLTGNDWFRIYPTWFAEYALVPMFFALSGFLVAGSAMRLTLRNFLINRSLRILPALAVDIVVCALVIGPIFTTAGLARYFGDRQFFLYFLNITGWVHFRLPGVFTSHPNYTVNGALWTVPYEMFCYAIMSALMVSRWITKPAMVGGSAVAFLLIGLAVAHSPFHLPQLITRALGFVFVQRGGQLLVAFMLGILAYQLKHIIPYDRRIMAACCIICLAAVFMLTSQSIWQVGNRFILLPALAYITVFLGLTPIPIPSFLHRGDYSYGVYLYHDPLLQVIISLIPGIVLVPGWGALILAPLGLVAVTFLAMFSWHVIEKPVLSLRKRFSFVARIRGVADAQDLSIAPPDVKRADTRAVASGLPPLRTG